MDLSKAIAELEQQAASYTAAANQLRALQGGAPAAAAAPAEDAPARRGRPAGSTKAKAPKASTGTRRVMSPETRAKIAAATKARHAARKAAAGA